MPFQTLSAVSQHQHWGVPTPQRHRNHVYVNLYTSSWKFFYPSGAHRGEEECVWGNLVVSLFFPLVYLLSLQRRYVSSSTLYLCDGLFMMHPQRSLCNVYGASGQSNLQLWDVLMWTEGRSVILSCNKRFWWFILQMLHAYVTLLIKNLDKPQSLG